MTMSLVLKLNERTTGTSGNKHHRTWEEKVFPSELFTVQEKKNLKPIEGPGSGSFLGVYTEAHHHLGGTPTVSGHVTFLKTGQGANITWRSWALTHRRAQDRTGPRAGWLPASSRAHFLAPGKEVVVLLASPGLACCLYHAASAQPRPRARSLRIFNGRKA